MSAVKIYGIKNCDTMKKAFAWLDKNGVAYDFHDYKKEGVDSAVLKKAIAQHGWDAVINCKGTTWRTLPDSLKNGMNDKTALKAAAENPSLVKRPLLVKSGKTHLGFDEGKYKRLLK